SFPGISVLEVEFNLHNQEAAFKLFPLLEKKQMGIVVKVPLARGLLTKNGKVKTGSFSYNEKPDLKYKENLEKLENEINKKILPEAAIRFILEYQQVSTFIVGTRSITHLKENLRILSNPNLSYKELEKVYKTYSPKKE
ncbi:MAG TPA: aldo/keto reductase, partial [Ignavibacteriaceae bacterium]